MKILIIGNGGREDAIAWKISGSESFKSTGGKMFCTIGNPGINNHAEPIEIKPDDIKRLRDFAIKEEIDFTVVGPELPLSLGIVNEFENSGLKIFGPKKEAAAIESSKVFAKDLMLKSNIPTAKFTSFDNNNLNHAAEYLKQCNYPVVIKADGLASGKGVFIIKDHEEAKETVEELTVKKIFGKAGENFIIEEYLDGEEVSVFAVTDGEDFVMLPLSQDHKKIGEGESGKNTGGMGAVAPLERYNSEKLTEEIKTKIIKPVLNALKENGIPFKGCLYCGLMIVNGKPYVIEFNCRFGDPETQAVLPLIKSDFLNLLMASAENKIKDYKLELNELFTCCVVLASEGYPGNFEKGKIITGLNDIYECALVFHSSTKSDAAGKILTDGGRVLSVVGLSKKSLEEAAENAYSSTGRINFDNKYYRRDIGFRQFKQFEKEAGK